MGPYCLWASIITIKFLSYDYRVFMCYSLHLCLSLYLILITILLQQKSYEYTVCEDKSSSQESVLLKHRKTPAVTAMWRLNQRMEYLALFFPFYHFVFQIHKSKTSPTITAKLLLLKEKIGYD